MADCETCSAHCGSSVVTTRNSEVEYDFTWIIENFSKTTTELRSPCFHPIPGCSENWYVDCVGSSRNSTDYQPLLDNIIDIEINHCSALGRNIRVEWEASIVNSIGRKWKSSKGTHVFNAQQYCCNCVSFLIDKNPLKIYKNVLCNMCRRNFNLPGDVLIIKIHMKISGYSMTTTISTAPPVQRSENFKKLSNDLQSVFQSGRYSDITLCAEGSNIEAHKLILCARSPVFAKMFEHDMKGESSNVIKISDIQFPVLQALLSFTYTGEEGGISTDMAYHLYSAADKYEMYDLRQACAHIMGANLTVDTVCLILILGDMHRDEGLMAMSKNFVGNHLAEVTARSDWLWIAENKPHLAYEVLRCFSSAYGGKK